MYKILVIDDNSMLHQDFKKIFFEQQTYGDSSLNDLESQLFAQDQKPPPIINCFELDFAFQGQEGLNKVKQGLANKQPFSLAFVDVRMPPGWDGIETAKNLWEVDPDLEIIFCSAYLDFSLEEMHRLIPNKQEFLIINKPFDRIEIRQAAFSLCKKWTITKQLQQQINETKEQLIHADKMASIGQLAAGVAHEINNPVGYINSNLHTLQRYVHDMLNLIDIYQEHETDLLPQHDQHQRLIELKKSMDLNFIQEDIMNLIKESCEGVARVKKIVYDLKDFSHQGSKDFDDYDLNSGIESTLNIVHNEIKYKADVVKELGTVPDIEAVGPQINQVILNLLVNASHAMTEKGTITIQSGQNDDSVWFSVTDTGKGIDPAHIRKIFEPFYTTKPVGTGTGLGLSLSYGIIQNHHGHIDVSSQLNRGTTFKVSLPIHQNQSTPSSSGARHG